MVLRADLKLGTEKVGLLAKVGAKCGIESDGYIESAGGASFVLRERERAERGSRRSGVHAWLGDGVFEWCARECAVKGISKRKGNEKCRR